MKLLPKSDEGWEKFFFVPFRTYVIAAFMTEYVMESYWPQHGGSPPYWVGLITCGYILSFFFFFVNWLSAREKKASRQHFVFMLIALLLGLYSLRYLATA